MKLSFKKQNYNVENYEEIQNKFNEIFLADDKYRQRLHQLKQDAFLDEIHENDKKFSTFLKNTFNECLSNSDNPLKKYSEIESRLFEYIKNNKDSLKVNALLDYNGLLYYSEEGKYTTINDHFKKNIANLSHDNYKKILNELKNDIVNKDSDLTVDELQTNVEKYKAIKECRNKRGFFRKIGDFFLGRKKAEDRIIDEIKTNIRNDAKTLGIEKKNIDYVLSQDDNLTTSDVYYKISYDVYEARREYDKDNKIKSIFSEGEINIKQDMSHDEFMENLKNLSGAINDYNTKLNDKKYSKNELDHFLKEIKDVTKELKISDKLLENVMKQPSKSKIFNYLTVYMEPETLNLYHHDEVEKANVPDDIIEPNDQIDNNEFTIEENNKEPIIKEELNNIK